MSDEQKTQGEAPQEGWYHDPEDPGSGRRRYWDGERWTDQFSGGEAARGTRLAMTIGGLVLVAFGSYMSTVAYTREESFETTSNVAGYFVGGLLIPLGLVLGSGGCTCAWVAARRRRGIRGCRSSRAVYPWCSD